MSFMFSSKADKSASSSSSSLPKKGPMTSEIFTVPPAGVIPKKQWDYDASQLKMIEDLRAYTKSIMLPESHPYHQWEARFLADPGCHPRYMRAAKWKPEDGKKRIKGTIEWRREFKPELIEPGDVGVEAETGKIIFTGFDGDARPLLYMRPGRENTEQSPRQIRHLIYNLERAIDFMPAGQDQVCIIVDYRSATSSSTPSIGTGRKVLGILQNHYVERLGRGCVVNMPWWINAFFSGISPFMDPLTRDKIRFNPKLVDLVPADQLDAEFGGDYNFEYDYKSYWPTITEFCCIAPDGTRVNREGQNWVPPSGYGIKAALDGLVPRAGASQTGQVARAENGEAGDALQGKQSRDVDATGAAGGVAAGATLGATASTMAGTTTSAAGEPHSPAQHIRDEPQAIPKEPQAGTTPKTATGGIEQGLADLAVSDAPAVQTAPGAPEGDVVFDHPPSRGEMQEARVSMDERRSVDQVR